jgi:hypothetical protein
LSFLCNFTSKSITQNSSIFQSNQKKMMTLKLKTHIIIVSVIHLCFFYQVSGQETPTEDTIAKTKPFHFIVIEGGLGHGAFRDKGVSPLIYDGVLPTMSLQHTATKPHYIFNASGRISGGIMSSTIDNASYFSQLINMSLQFDYFRKIHESNNQKLHYFMGFGLRHDAGIRVSPHLMNAQFVFDNFSGAYINGRVQLDLKIKALERKIWFVNYKKPARNYSLACNMHLPFAGFLYRPGFSYVGHATTNSSELFDGYKGYLLLFSGLRMRVEALKHLENGNALGFAYDFRVFNSKNYLNNYLQTAEQLVAFSLLYRLK